MPIPTGGAWPPPAYAPAYAAYRDWDAWYTGDPDRLREVYLNRAVTGQSLPPSQRVRAGQYAGGIVGMFSRWLWGTPPTPGQRDGRLHVPLPADLAATAANLLFAEPPALTFEDKAVQARLEQLVEDGLNNTLLHAAEAASPLGDVYLRPVIDRDVYPDRAFLAAVHADGALPVIRWGRLIEVTFWSELENDGHVVRLLEHHDVVTGADGSRAGRIQYAVHEGTPTQLGRAISLADHPGSAHLADLVDETGAQATGLDRLDVVRIPNAGPQRRWRTKPALKYLGRSDFDGNEQVFDRIDEVWTSWMRDIRLARARIVVPEYMLESKGPGKGAVFDAEREVFAAVNALPPRGGDASGQGITLSQFAIRHAEHKATADALTEVAMRHAGLSAQTLGEEGDIAATATEVQARERQSFTTRGVRIQGSWRSGVADAIELLLAVERAQLGGKAEPVRPNVEFPDGVSESPETVARTVQLLDAANAISIEMKVRMVHPDWDDRQVRAEVRRIREDQPIRDPGTFTGDLGGEDAEAEEAEGGPAGEE